MPTLTVTFLLNAKLCQKRLHYPLPNCLSQAPKIELPHGAGGMSLQYGGGKMVLSQFSQSVHSLSCVQLFATPWTAARQGSRSITNSQSLLKLMSIKLVMPFSHLILCHPLLLLASIFPSIRVFFFFFPMSQFFALGRQSIGASASVLPMTIQN